MSDPTINLISSTYDQRILTLTKQFQADIELYSKNPNFNIIFQELNVIFMKNLGIINAEKNNFITLWNLHQQSLQNFMNIGKQMSEIKQINKKTYDHIVDKAFAYDSPLSLYKFKYASKL